MLGRCRLRRGVSLEVIVEEDDNAEVSFDPTPLMEEDDDDDDDDDSENGTGGSTPSSPREDDGRGGHGEGKSSIEERRRKRERRRTIGGLSRFRSVSCEALTLLDTSDMDSCCSEWDDEDEMATSSSLNYVTLNRPISRRRIIENSQSQCDSEDSGIEYHSNEDDHVLEDHSSNEDHIEDEEDVKEEEEEVDREGTTEEDNQQDEDQEEEEEGDESATITMESDEEDVEEIQADAQDVVEVDKKQSPKQERRKDAVQTGKFAYSPNEALENDKIIIVETTPPVPIIRKTQQSGQEAAEEEMRLKREAYTIRNKEVRLAELPKPHTVKSVKQLFENLNTPVHHFHAWRDLGRFRDIKSNPSSKILRFDRHDGKDAALSRSRLMSLTLPRLPSQGGHRQSMSTKTTNDSTTKIKATHEVETPERATKKVPKNYQETPMSRILAQSVAHKGTQKGECHSARSGSKSQEPLQQVKTQNGEKVVLRKPIVKGFNVKRALMENPRNFLPHNHNHQQQQTKNNNSQKNIRQRLGHPQKSHHHSETTDKSDTESLASDISDDSGVSNDSLASTTSSTPSSYRALDAYASDPSFMWIDPAVMAKIRSVGTTVIFFGPRQRPRQDGGTLPRGKKSTSSGLQVTRGHQTTRGGQTMSRTSQPTSQSKKGPAIRQQVPNNIPVPAPRIVGVVRKQSTGTISTSGATSANTSPSPSVYPTPAPTPTPADTHSDDSRASSPASRSEDGTSSPRKAGKWRSETDTIVYNFTQPQPPAVYF